MVKRIVSAIDYGFRKVIRVVMDDAIPEWVHPIDGGAAHVPTNARGPFLPDGTPGPLDPSLQAGTECHACVFNHDVREFIFTGEEIQIEDPAGSGVFRNKTDSELVIEIQFRLLPPEPVTPIGRLQNQVI